MKKKLFVSLIAFLAVAVIATNVHAEATRTSALNARAARHVSSVIAIAEAAGGYTLEIDNRGAASTLEYPKSITGVTGGTLWAGTGITIGASRLHSITVGGVGTSAGDYVLVYDALTATGTPVFEVSVGTAKDTNTVSIPGGVTFSTGIFIKSNSTNVHAAVAYDE